MIIFCHFVNSGNDVKKGVTFIKQRYILRDSKNYVPIGNDFQL